MTSISKRYTEALARLKRLEAKQQVHIVHESWLNAPRFCPTCDKDVPVVVVSRMMDRTLVSVTCEACGADLKDVKASNAPEDQ